MMQPLEAVEGNRILLQQAADLLRRMDDATYAMAGGEGGRSPVGVHFRHVLDHYRAFFAGLPDGEIDYDDRARQVPLETDRTLAIEAVLGYLADLGRLHPGLAARPLRVSLRSAAGRGPGPDWSTSSLQRELQFLVSHTVHHFALIQLALSGTGLASMEGFGVAPSTLAARQSEAGCAR